MKDITFFFESDGDPGRMAYYIIAQHKDWSDAKRLDFAKKALAKDTAKRLRAGQITMEEAAKLADGKWL